MTTIQPSPYGDSAIGRGSSLKAVFDESIVPDSGDNNEWTVFTLSMLPISSPASTD